VYLGIPLEIMRDGFLRDVLDLHAKTLELLDRGLEVAKIAGEHRLATTCEQTRHADKKLHVITLHVPGSLAHRLRIGKRRRIDEDQIEAAAAAARESSPRWDPRTTKGLVLYADHTCWMRGSMPVLISSSAV